MFMAYVDESGNAGWNGSVSYTLGCVMLEDNAWPDAFDGLLEFRRWVRDRFGLLLRDEIKANYLIRNSGPFKRFNLGDNIRSDIYRQHLRVLSKIDTYAFAVVIRKEQMWNRDRDPREIAWEFLLQRLERLSEQGDGPVMLMHDEGEEAAVRALARKARRAGRAGSAFGTGSLSRPFRRLLDDPVPRRSDHSFFIQLADLVAYAGFRRAYPSTGKPGHICPPSMWNEIGTATYGAANYLKGEVPGLVIWPT